MWAGRLLLGYLGFSLALRGGIFRILDRRASSATLGSGPASVGRGIANAPIVPPRLPRLRTGPVCRL